MYTVIDLETTTTERYKRKGNPFISDNYIVAIGLKNQWEDKCFAHYFHSKDDVVPLVIPDKTTLLVGFNIKFDLLYLWNDPSVKAFFKRGGKIWDCQYVEYLLHGQAQEYHYSNLDKTAPKYGGTKKVDEIKRLWEMGVNTNEIDKKLLLEYLIGADENGGDIGNTELVFKGQVKKAIELNMVKAIQSRMDGLLSTTEMEYNGLYVDVPTAYAHKEVLEQERAELLSELDKYVPDLPEGCEFNWSSNVHKSCVLFGGSIGYKVRGNYIDPKTGDYAKTYEEQLHYLLDDDSTVLVSDTVPDNVQRFKGGASKGLPKTKKVKVESGFKTKWLDKYFTFQPLCSPNPEWKSEITDALGKPVYSVSGDNITELAAAGIPFCKALYRYTELCKELGTYYISTDKDGKDKGMLTCVDEKGFIHHGLNHVSTVTGRLSSSNPNLQNIPRADSSDPKASKVKSVFKSRFGDDGYMVEIDFSQLEVVVQGLLTGDSNLCQDLRDKIDFHCKRIAIQKKYGKTYEEVLAIIKDESHPEHKLWKRIRTLTKIFSFQRAYGAGAALIALETGMTKEEVLELIVAEEDAYPDIKPFYQSVEKSAHQTATPFRDPALNYRMYKRGFWTAPTGCRYSFRTYDSLDFLKQKGIYDSFSPTQIKNYPIQGTGGEIVQGVIGRLWRKFIERDNFNNKAFLVNTVHDCVWIDLHKSVLHDVVPLACDTLQAVPEWLSQFGIDCPVPFPVEAEYGANLQQLTHYSNH